MYDYSTNDDTWNISPLKQDSFEALAVRDDKIVLIDTYKEEQGKELIRIKGYPLTSHAGDNENENIITTLPVKASTQPGGGTLPVKANTQPGGGTLPGGGKLPVKASTQPGGGHCTFLSTASDKNTLVIGYSNLMVLFNQSKPVQLAFPSSATNSTHEYTHTYYRCLLYDNHLYLSPISPGSEHDNDCQWYCIQLPQNNEHTEHDKVPSSLDDDLSPPKHKKIHLDQESAIKWKPMPKLLHGCSNLACFGKQLVTVRSGSWHRGIEIQAYSKKKNSWVVVAENEDFDHRLGEYSSIFHLDDTGELLVIECGNNHRDVHKLSIEGTYYYITKSA